MSSPVFSPNVLSSYGQLRGFFEANKNADTNRILSPLNKREITAQFMTHIYNSIKIVSMRFIRGLDRKLTPFESIFLKELSENRLDDSSINKCLAPFSKKDLLAPAKCFQRIDTPDLYMQKKIPVSRIKDPQIIKKINTYFTELKDIDFFCEGGVCRGEGIWFSTLYFETKKKFPDTLKGRIQHIRAVTNLFSRGAPRAASVIQALALNYSDISLRDLVEHPGLFFYYKRTPLLGTRVDNLDQLAKHFRKLPPGVYDFGLKKHASIYIKLDENKSVFFDPNTGSILIDGELGEKKLAEYIMKWYGIIDDGILKGQILSIYKLTDRTPLSELKRQILLYEIFRLNLWGQVCVFSFPLRLCYSSTAQLVKDIYDKCVYFIIPNRQQLHNKPLCNA